MKFGKERRLLKERDWKDWIEKQENGIIRRR